MGSATAVPGGGESLILIIHAHPDRKCLGPQPELAHGMTRRELPRFEHTRH